MRNVCMRKTRLKLPVFLGIVICNSALDVGSAVMAQGGSFFEDVKKELECSVCQEQFSELNEPKILKCLHTFCKNCLEAWLRKRHEGGLSCPTCRQITDCPNNDISRLPSNLFYKQMVEIVEAYGGQAEESPRCGNCEEKKSLKWYCSDCNFFLCDECVVAHRKWKMFSKHQVKEIGNFRSSDLEDYARKANFCKKHKDEARFFCENCQICICRDCAILDHRDHNIFSLEKGLEDKKSEIEAKMRKVQDSGSRLKIHKDSLEKRRLKVNSSIEEATSEVKRVAERCISMIHEHQTSVTEQLVEQKAAFQNAFEAQMTILDTKLMDIDNTLAFCEDVLLRKNLTEILNVKATIEQRLQELSVTSGSEFIPKLDYSQVKYVSNDVSFAPGRLVTTKTESSLSVAEERNRLSEGSVGADGTFTVNAKDSGDQNTYNSVVFPLEENVYDMAPTKISRSIFVAGFPTTTTTEDLIIHFQCKRNGGGNIESIIVSKQGTAVITFDDPEGENYCNISGELARIKLNLSPPFYCRYENSDLHSRNAVFVVFEPVFCFLHLIYCFQSDMNMGFLSFCQ